MKEVSTDRKIIYYVGHPREVYRLHVKEEIEEHQVLHKLDIIRAREDGINLDEEIEPELISPFSGGSGEDRLNHIREVYLP